MTCLAAFSKATSDTDRQSSSYVIESQEQEYSYFLGSKNYLESVVAAYFNLRPVEDEQMTTVMILAATKKAIRMTTSTLIMTLS